MKVRAIHLGYYQNKRIRPGQEFELVKIEGKKKLKDGKYEDLVLEPEHQFSDRWMEKLEEDEKSSAKPKKEDKKKDKPRPSDDVI